MLPKKARNIAIAQDILAGKSYRKIAQQYNISAGRISQIIKQDEIQDILTTGTQQLIALVPLAVDNYLQLLQGDDPQLRYKASQDLLRTVGIMPSHAVSTVITKILNVTNNIVLDPRVESAIGGALDSLEVDFEVVESGEGGDN